MDIRTERVGPALVAMAEGRIDGRNAADFEDSLNGLITPALERLVLDLSNLVYIGCDGLRALLVIGREAGARRSVGVSLCAVPAPIREVLTIAGFDRELDICDTRDEALSAAAGAS